MIQLAMPLLLSGASSACGFAALGLALYARTPALYDAATLFGGVGFLAGLVCGGLHAVMAGRQAPATAALPPETLASLVRAAVASANAERQPRSGSAADRRPTPAEAAAVVLAEAAARPAPVQVDMGPMPAADEAVKPVLANPPSAWVDSRRLADSTFGA